MRFFKKSEEEINKNIVNKLKTSGFYVEDGSISKLFAGIFSSVIYTIYVYLENKHLNCFISTADREHLNKKANDLGISLSDNISMEEIRYEIANHVENKNSCSEEVIRKKILKISTTVQDVKFKNFTNGAGSCTIYIYSKKEATGEIESITKELSSMIPIGVKVKVGYPKRIPVLLKLKVNSYKSSLSDQIEIKGSITKNVNNLFLIGTRDGISIYDLINTIKISDKSISSVYILKCSIDGIEKEFTKINSDIDIIYHLSTKTEIIF